MTPRLAHARRRSAVGPRPPRSLRERGAAVVEFAIVVTLLVTLALGAVEMGFQWRYAHDAAAASRTGARVGARLGTDAQTDLQILTTVRTSLQSAGARAEVDRVIIYRANGDGTPPASCTREVGPSGTCNVYQRSIVNDVDLGPGSFGADGCHPGAQYRGWCPADRETDQRIADYVGVMVVLDTDSITGMFPIDEISRHSVMRMEPTAS